VDATAICPDAGAATDGSTGTGVGSDVTTEAGVGVRTDWEHETIPITSMARVAMARLYLMTAPYGGLPKCPSAIITSHSSSALRARLKSG